MKDGEIERISVNVEQVAQLLEHAKRALLREDYEILEDIVKSFAYFTARLEEKRASVRQLRKLLFGFKSEKLRNVLKGIEEAERKREEHTGTQDAAARAGASAEPGSASRAGEDSTAEGETVAEPGSPEGATVARALDEALGEGPVAGDGEKEKPKGHGRNGADAYESAERIAVEHETLKPGDPCPQVGCKGKVYRFVPRRFVRIIGQAPVAAKVFEIQQLRCNLCLEVFSARAPEDIGEKKYTPSAGSMIAILRYGTGVPMNRLEGLEGSLGVPLASATQWDVLAGVEKLVAPAYRELMCEAAQGDVFYNDDTTMKILELMKRKGEGDDG